MTGPGVEPIDGLFAHEVDSKTRAAGAPSSERGLLQCGALCCCKMALWLWQEGGQRVTNANVPPPKKHTPPPHHAAPHTSAPPPHRKTTNTAGQYPPHRHSPDWK
jgi:hypothetical protein